MNLQPNPLTAAQMREIREGIIGVTPTTITYRPGATKLPAPADDAAVLIVVGGGLMQWESFVQARLLGFRVAMTDRDPHCFMAQHADIFREIDVFDSGGHEVLVRWLRAQGHTVAGIFVGGIDAELTAATVASTFGMLGISEGAAYACKDKLVMRRAFLEADVSPIQWCYARTVQHIPPHMWIAMGRTGALVVKPRRNSASRGIRIVREYVDMADAITFARDAGGDDLVLIEEYLAGSQHSVEIARVGDAWVGLNIVDRIFDSERPLIEIGHVNPSVIPSRESHGFDPHTQVSREEVFDLVQRAADALGVTEGVFKADIVIHPTRGPLILECTARLSGGFDSQVTTPLTGRNFVALGIALATGRQVDPDWLRRTRYQTIACVAEFPPPGVIADYYALNGSYQEMRFFYESKHPYVGADILRFVKGDRIPPYADCGGRAAFAVRSDGYDSGAMAAWEEARNEALSDMRSFKIDPIEGDDPTVPIIPERPTFVQAVTR